MPLGILLYPPKSSRSTASMLCAYCGTVQEMPSPELNAHANVWGEQQLAGEPVENVAMIGYRDDDDDT